MEVDGLKTIFIPEAVAMRVAPAPNMAMISISDFEYDPSNIMKVGLPRMAALTPGWQNLLRLNFHDIDVPNGDFIMFNALHARAVITFLKGLDVEKIDTVIVHCFAGISRSAAVAKFVADFFDIEIFNHDYPLYNKRVYATLKKEFKEEALIYLTKVQ
jgi:hypothetical protein